MSGSSVVNSNNMGAAATMFFTMGSDAVLLPATMSPLAAREQPDGINIAWTVFTEAGIDRYVVEKSADGLHYYTAGSLPSKGNSNAAVAYSWLDRSIAATNNYYRLKIIGRDGDAKYSNIVRVVIVRAPGIHIYPNPVRGNNISLELVNIEKGVYHVIVSTQLGQPVFSQTVAHAGGSAVFTLRSGSELTAGIYELLLSGNGLYERVGVIKY